jgi:nucleoside-diphosphate-sugar epimerase
MDKIMKHVLVGYGYCASYLASQLLAHQESCLAISRGIPKQVSLGIEHIQQDICQSLPSFESAYTLYYFIPPLVEKDEDKPLALLLGQLQTLPEKIIYVGSSGIYGHHKGQLVDESSPCYIETPRQLHRQIAEQQLLEFSKCHGIPCCLLRVAGIYGPNRIPLEAVFQQAPIVQAEQAPLINHIYIEDLANILYLLGTSTSFHGILNICDGQPHPMGYMQQLLADLLNHPRAEELPFQDIWQHASPMKREFMSQNKMLSNARLKQLFDEQHLHLHSLEMGLNKSLQLMENCLY